MKIALILLILLFPLISGVCEEGYDLILFNNWEVNETYFEDKYNISFDEFIETYPENCQLNGSPPLPNKPNYPILVIYSNYTECNLETKGLLNISTQLPGKIFINLGEKKCSFIEKIKYFVDLNYFEGYQINGIKLLPILVLVILLILFILLKKERKIRRLV